MNCDICHKDTTAGSHVTRGRYFVELLMGLPIGWTDINVAKEDIESWQGWPAAINVEQYAYEPPRVIVGQKNRAKRLKALGNGCVPQQVYLVFAAIVEVENEA